MRNAHGSWWFPDTVKVCREGLGYPVNPKPSGLARGLTVHFGVEGLGVGGPSKYATWLIWPPFLTLPKLGQPKTQIRTAPISRYWPVPATRQSKTGHSAVSQFEFFLPLTGVDLDWALVWTIFGSMRVYIDYFGKPPAPGGITPQILRAVTGKFATSEAALQHARRTANKLGARSFLIDFPDHTVERYVCENNKWTREDA